MTSGEHVQESVWECRRTKIELEHEVLLREMEATLVAEVGVIISGLPSVLLAKLDTTITVIAVALVACLFVALDIFRLDRKEKIVIKEKELDVLVLEITKSMSQESSSR